MLTGKKEKAPEMLLYKAIVGDIFVFVRRMHL